MIYPPDLSVIERRIARLSYENAIGWSAVRQEFWLKGTADHVPIDGDKRSAIWDGFLTHNHPHPASQIPSFRDLAFAMVANLHVLRTVSYASVTKTIEIREFKRRDEKFWVGNYQEYIDIMAEKLSKVEIRFFHNEAHGLIVPNYSLRAIDALDDGMDELAKLWTFFYHKWSIKV